MALRYPGRSRKKYLQQQIFFMKGKKEKAKKIDFLPFLEKIIE